MKRRRTSLRRLALGAAAGFVAGCATQAPPLYSWEAFPRHQYDTLLREGKSPLEQIRAMESQAEKARAKGLALPPGFRAHLGMLHLTVGDADAARRYLEAEKAAFPEAEAYMDRLLERLGPRETRGTANPA